MKKDTFTASSLTRRDALKGMAGLVPAVALGGAVELGVLAELAHVDHEGSGYAARGPWRAYR